MISSIKPSLQSTSWMCIVSAQTRAYPKITVLLFWVMPTFVCLRNNGGFQSLKDLVLQKLHATLRIYKPCKARCGDVVELIRYVYENTPSRKHMHGLRELVTQYVVHEAPQIAGPEPCLSLVEDGRPFARDLLSTPEKAPQ